MLPNDVFFFSNHGFAVEKILTWKFFLTKFRLSEGHLCDETILRFWSGIIAFGEIN